MYCSLVKGAAHVTILVGSILSTTVVGVADGFLETDLVSDLPGRAKTLDPNLVNAWGLATSSTSPFWVANNGTGTSTLYNKQGVPQPPGTNPPHDPLIVSIPIPSNPTGRDGTPTGAVFNIGSSSGAFPIPPIPPTGTTTKPSIFLFATEDGTIVGWNPAINPPGSDPTLAGTFGTIAVDNSGNNFANPPPANPTGAVYKGLAIAHANQPIFSGNANTTSVIYVTNFRSGKVEVYDSQFGPVTLPAGAFTDPSLPNFYAPFNIVEINGKLVVTYAVQNAQRHDDVAGQSHGFVNIFNLDGSGLQRLAQHGQLNSPWGVALAPAGFGEFAGALLIGNFGNGHINAFDPNTGEFIDRMRNPHGQTLVIDGLWSLRVGNGSVGGDIDKVYFTAGPNGETHGLFGVLCSVSSPTCPPQ
jgi:uncharacterized protein (TIGR03118 family)